MKLKLGIKINHGTRAAGPAKLSRRTTITLAVVATAVLIMLLTTYIPHEDDSGTAKLPEQIKQADDIGKQTAATPEAGERDNEETPPPTEPDTAETTQPEDDDPPSGTDAPVGTIWTTDTELSDKLNDIAAEYNCVGVTLAAYDPQHGYSTYQYGYADIASRRPVNSETKFRVASLTKTVVAIIAVKLYEDGKLDLDEDISEYLGYQVSNPYFPEVPITVRMLIQHTAALYDSDGYMSGQITYTANTTKELLGERTVHRRREPGTLHEYSDFGYNVLGAVCEQAGGKLLNALADEIIFSPMGIDAAFVASELQNQVVASQYGANHTLRLSAEALLANDNTETTGHQHAYAVGNLTITALDYAKILSLLVHGGTDGRVRILSEESVAMINKADVLGDRGYMQGLSVRYVHEGFMNDSVYYHTGSAYGTLAQYFYSLETGHIAVVITTGSNSERGIFNSIVVCTEMSQLLWK